MDNILISINDFFCRDNEKYTAYMLQDMKQTLKHSNLDTSFVYDCKNLIFYNPETIMIGFATLDMESTFPVLQHVFLYDRFRGQKFLYQIAELIKAYLRIKGHSMGLINCMKDNDVFVGLDKVVEKIKGTELYDENTLSKFYTCKL